MLIVQNTRTEQFLRYASGYHHWQGHVFTHDIRQARVYRSLGGIKASIGVYDPALFTGDESYTERYAIYRDNKKILPAWANVIDMFEGVEM